ncbi:MAG: FkbM family methyltransferase, partial [Ferruginibacter sp.]
MELFGRKVRLDTLFSKCIDLTRMFFKSFTFNEVASLWTSYIKLTNPKSNKFTTRDGYQILLSNNLHDGITVMVIFCRLEYGKVDPGSIVIDIGANIGVFSLYAARCGAKKVYAFEPNKKSYEILLNNIKVNNLEKIIIPFNLAVGSSDGEIISIPKNSSPYNATVYGKLDEAHYDFVETICLPSFIIQN